MSSVMQSEHIFRNGEVAFIHDNDLESKEYNLTKRQALPSMPTSHHREPPCWAEEAKTSNSFSTHNPNALDVIAMAIMKLGLCPPTEGAVVGSEVEASWLLSDKAGPRCLGGKGAVWEICRDQGNTQCWACFSPLLCWRPSTYDTSQLMRKMLTFADIWSKVVQVCQSCVYH